MSLPRLPHDGLMVAGEVPESIPPPNPAAGAAEAARDDEFEVVKVAAGSQWNMAMDPSDPEAAIPSFADDLADDLDSDVVDDVEKVRPSRLLVRKDSRPFKYTPIYSDNPTVWASTRPHLIFNNVKLYIVVTLYNEEAHELAITLRAICKNIKFLCKKLGRPDFWRQVAVCIVCDGRDKISASTVSLAESLNIIDGASMQSAVDDQPIGAHLFECVASFEDNEAVGSEFPPLQIDFVVKERNSGKIGSHWWFFEGTSAVLKPSYCVLLDVGTTARPRSLYSFLAKFESDSRVAGVCGRITTRQNDISSLGLMSLSQHFEYKVASVLDKSFESSCGFMSVLPGAFSAYRFGALQGRPLQQYFSQLFIADKDLQPFKSNMMLAEDRVLCFELTAKPGCDYVLKYVNRAVAETDVPGDLVSLVKQRRRWLNGSFFALLYALSHFWQFYTRTSHSRWRKAAITWEFLFFCLSVLVQWFAIASFLLIVVLVSDQIGIDPRYYITVAVVFSLLVLLQFLMARINNPQRLRFLYIFSSIAFGVMMIGILVLTMAFSIEEIKNGQPVVIITLSLSWGIYIIGAVLHGELLSLLATFVPFLFMMPTYLIMFPIFAFMNVNDISWGTKDLDKAAFGASSDDSTTLSKELLQAEQERRQSRKKRERRRVRRRFLWFLFKLVFSWIISNVALVVVVLNYSGATPFLITILIFLILMNGSRLLGAIVYLTGSQTSSSTLLKILINPFRPRVYVSLFKLPFSAAFSVVSFVVCLLSLAMEEDSGARVLRRMARIDLKFSHLLTSKAAPKVSADQKQVLDGSVFDTRIRRHLLLWRPLIAIGSFLLTLTGCVMLVNALKPSLNVCDSYPCFADLTDPRTTIAPLIYVVTNLSYGTDFVLRRLSNKLLML